MTRNVYKLLKLLRIKEIKFYLFLKRTVFKVHIIYRTFVQYILHLEYTKIKNTYTYLVPLNKNMYACIYFRIICFNSAILSSLFDNFGVTPKDFRASHNLPESSNQADIVGFSVPFISCKAKVFAFEDSICS